MVTSQKLVKNRPPFPLEGVIIGLLGVVYGPLLWHWIDGWLNKSISIQHEYFSHAMIGIPYAIYIAWETRKQWQTLPDKLNLFGIVGFILALLMYSTGLVDLMNLSLPLMLISICLMLKGLPGLKLQAFPLVLIFFSTPTQFPYLIEPYILPLQKFIASVAGFILLNFGVDVEVNQIYLMVNQQLVEVAPHCAGLKMLFTSLFTGLMLTHWTLLHRVRLHVATFFVGTICISVVGNIIRNAVLSYFHGNRMDDAFHWLHESWGGDLYSAVMLGSLIPLIYMIQKYVPKTLQLKAVDVPSEDFTPPAPEAAPYSDNF